MGMYVLCRQLKVTELICLQHAAPNETWLSSFALVTCKAGARPAVKQMVVLHGGPGGSLGHRSRKSEAAWVLWRGRRQARNNKIAEQANGTCVHCSGFAWRHVISQAAVRRHYYDRQNVTFDILLLYIGTEIAKQCSELKPVTFSQSASSNDLMWIGMVIITYNFTEKKNTLREWTLSLESTKKAQKSTDANNILQNTTDGKVVLILAQSWNTHLFTEQNLGLYMGEHANPSYDNQYRSHSQT